MVPKRVDHAARRREIAEALGRIAAERGARSVTMRDVATEAGCSLGLVQYYFPSKDELLLAALRHLTERVAKRVQRAVRALGPDASERDRIRVTLRQFLPLDHERRAATTLFRAFHDGGVNNLTTTGAQARKVPQMFHQTMTRRLEVAGDAGQLRPGVTVETEARIYQLVITSLAESLLAGFVTTTEATATIDYLLDRAFVPPKDPS